VIVSSEDAEIIEYATGIDGISAMQRPDKLAVDPASVLDVCNYVLDNLDSEPEYVWIMLPSTPLRDSEDLKEMNKILSQKEADSVMSATEYNYPLRFAYTIDENSQMQKEFTDQDMLKPRTYCADNGGAYAMKLRMTRDKKYISDKTYAYVMPFWKSVDIDNPEDLDVAKAMYSYYVLGDGRK
jgi:N-acylneuraminate cytidylyltransferase/CMP-N,N'-diacetyllegionaminic acid synthase